MRYLAYLLLIVAGCKGGSSEPDATWNGWPPAVVEENRRWAAERIPKLQDPAYGKELARRLAEAPANPHASAFDTFALCGSSRLSVVYSPLTDPPRGSLIISMGVGRGPALPDRLRIDGLQIANPREKPGMVSYEPGRAWPVASFDVELPKFPRLFPTGDRTLTLEVRVNVLEHGKYTSETKRWRLRMRVFDEAEQQQLRDLAVARARAHDEKSLLQELGPSSRSFMENLRRQPTAEIEQYVDLFDRRTREARNPPPEDHPAEALRNTLTVEPINPC